MNPLHWQGALAATFLLLFTAGCGEKSSSPAAPAASSAPASQAPPVQPASSTQPVTPHAPETGPAAGGTAIGGVVGSEQQGTTKKGDVPAPTGGDGSAK